MNFLKRLFFPQLDNKNMVVILLVSLTIFWLWGVPELLAGFSSYSSEDKLLGMIWVAGVSLVFLLLTFLYMLKPTLSSANLARILYFLFVGGASMFVITISISNASNITQLGIADLLVFIFSVYAAIGVVATYLVALIALAFAKHLEIIEKERLVGKFVKLVSEGFTGNKISKTELLLITFLSVSMTVLGFVIYDHPSRVFMFATTIVGLMATLNRPKLIIQN